MSADVPIQFVEIHLFVTGHAERDALPEMFSRLTETGLCTVKVARKVGQRSPRTATARRHIEMVGRRAQTIPTEDEKEISFPARRLLRGSPHRLLLLIDDLEKDRRDEALAVFRRDGLSTLSRPFCRVSFIANSTPSKSDAIS